MLDEKNYSYVSIEEAMTPTNGAMVRVDTWWEVHPEKGLVFFRRYSPQCNSSEFIARKIQESTRPDCDVRFFPVVYIPARHQAPPSDY